MNRVFPKSITDEIDMTFQYIDLANEIEIKVLNGEFHAGERLPSLRKIHNESNNSISTVHKAYMELERRGIVEAREKSGFFVSNILHHRQESPKLVECQKNPQKVRVAKLSHEMTRQVGKTHLTSVGLAIPANDILPLKQFSKIFKSISIEEMDHVFGYDRSMGSLELRRQIAKRTLGVSGRISSEEIIITNGCMDAISLCLRAVAKPGDIIGVETPTYNGFLQLIEQNNMFALELPTNLTEGVEVDKLEEILDSQQVKACLFNPSYQNPLGYVMPNEKREKLVRLMNHKNIPIIEDDVFGELHFEERRPSTLKSFDEKGLVLYCSSFSKTLAPGLRVGWAIPGIFMEQVQELKSNLSLSGSKLNQYLIVQFLKNDSYERQLRFVRNELKKQMSDLIMAVVRYFPKDTRISNPGGGLNLWVQLNDKIDTIELHREALLENILVMPGVLCSVSGRYQNCIRLGCGNPVTRHFEKSIEILGQIIYDLM